MMGMWDYKPWDNDPAADWYGDLMEATNLRTEWLKGINADIQEEPEVVRAATGMFILLGHVYVWPIAEYDKDLELSIAKSRQLLDVEEFKESDELIAVIETETSELESRRKDSAPADDQGESGKPWWKFW